MSLGCPCSSDGFHGPVPPQAFPIWRQCVLLAHLGSQRRSISFRAVSRTYLCGGARRGATPVGGRTAARTRWCASEAWSALLARWMVCSQRISAADLAAGDFTVTVDGTEVKSQARQRDPADPGGVHRPAGGRSRRASRMNRPTPHGPPRPAPAAARAIADRLRRRAGGPGAPASVRTVAPHRGDRRVLENTVAAAASTSAIVEAGRTPSEGDHQFLGWASRVSRSRTSPRCVRWTNRWRSTRWPWSRPGRLRGGGRGHGWRTDVAQPGRTRRRARRGGRFVAASSRSACLIAFTPAEPLSRLVHGSAPGRAGCAKRGRRAADLLPGRSERGRGDRSGRTRGGSATGGTGRANGRSIPRPGQRSWVCSRCAWWQAVGTPAPSTLVDTSAALRSDQPTRRRTPAAMRTPQLPSPIPTAPAPTPDPRGTGGRRSTRPALRQRPWRRPAAAEPAGPRRARRRGARPAQHLRGEVAAPEPGDLLRARGAGHAPAAGARPRLRRSQSVHRTGGRR